MEKNTMIYKMKYGNFSKIQVIDTVLPTEDCITLVQRELLNAENTVSGSVIDATGKEVYHKQK